MLIVYLGSLISVLIWMKDNSSSFKTDSLSEQIFSLKLDSDISFIWKWAYEKGTLSKINMKWNGLLPLDKKNM